MLSKILHNQKVHFKSRPKARKKGKEDSKISSKEGSKEKVGASKKEKFPPCYFYKNTNHAKNDCWLKIGRLVYHYNFFNKDVYLESLCQTKHA